jgi:tRNA-2-methylthio-N6-dimethylallyladenosine synthase
LKHDLLENRPYVDIILGPDSYRKLPELLNRKNEDSKSIVDTTLSRFEVYDDLFPSRTEGINAWISIMRGCDKFCTFCIVPFTRGRERSRSIEGIVAEATQAVKNGFSEITLLGQNVNSYRFEGIEFHHLLEEVAQISGIKRIRYTSPHPQDMTDDLFTTMARHENICNSIHLPLQAGNDRILKRMNRTYTRDHFIQLAHRIRDMLPGVGITTDIIVGFPGETDEEFNETLSLMKEVKFDSAFNFKYSPRRGTKASEYDDQIPEDVKQDRLTKVINLQKRHTLERNLEMVGSTQTVLIEKESKKSSKQWAGRTDSNKWVIFDKEDAQILESVQVIINEAKGVSLHGQLKKRAEAA